MNQDTFESLSFEEKKDYLLRSFKPDGNISLIDDIKSNIIALPIQRDIYKSISTAVARTIEEIHSLETAKRNKLFIRSKYPDKEKEFPHLEFLSSYANYLKGGMLVGNFDSALAALNEHAQNYDLRNFSYDLWGAAQLVVTNCLDNTYDKETDVYLELSKFLIYEWILLVQYQAFVIFCEEELRYSTLTPKCYAMHMKTWLDSFYNPETEELTLYDSDNRKQVFHLPPNTKDGYIRFVCKLSLELSQCEDFLTDFLHILRKTPFMLCEVYDEVMNDDMNMQIFLDDFGSLLFPLGKVMHDATNSRRAECLYFSHTVDLLIIILSAREEIKNRDNTEIILPCEK